jgi:hypothetical protein
MFTDNHKIEGFQVMLINEISFFIVLLLLTPIFHGRYLCFNSQSLLADQPLIVKDIVFTKVLSNNAGALPLKVVHWLLAKMVITEIQSVKFALNSSAKLATVYLSDPIYIYDSILNYLVKGVGVGKFIRVK